MSGWQPLDLDTQEIFRKYKRVIMVYPHNSYADFVYYLMYMNAYPELGRKCKILINPFWMDKYGWALQYVGGVTATRREDTSGGAVKRVKYELQRMSEFILPVSPKGSMNAHRWRTGYYHLAKELDCHIVCAGFDYHHKKFIINEPFKIGNMTVQQVEDKCKDQLRNITPIHPERSEFPVDAHIVPLDANPISDYRIALIVAGLVILLLILVWAVMRNREQN